MRRRIVLAFLVLCLACGRSAIAAQTPSAEGRYKYVLSNEGDAALMVKTPNYQAAADVSQHIAIVPQDTEVRILEQRKDAALPIFGWSKVEVLEGRFEGKTGWVSSRAVKRVRAEAKTSVADSASPSSRLARSRNMGTAGRDPSGSTEGEPGRLIKSSKLYAAPSFVSGQTLSGSMPKDTTLLKLDERRDPSLQTVLWFRVRITDGANKGKTGWLLAHDVHLARKRIKSVVIANKSDAKSWMRAENLATNSSVTAMPDSDLDFVTDAQADLSQAEEVVFLEHSLGGEDFKGSIGSGDNPTSLAAKLKRARLADNTPLELIICNAGTTIVFPDKKRGTFAGRLAKQLGRPVIAYSHYVILVTAGCTRALNGCTTAYLDGYRYTIDPFTDERERIAVPVERRLFQPDESSKVIEGLPFAIAVHSSGRK